MRPAVLFALPFILREKGEEKSGKNAGGKGKKGKKRALF